MKITLTGSLGHIGRPLTQELVRKGHAVTVISSNPEKKKEIEDLGATAAIGSVDDTRFLESVFAGADAVYLMVPPNFAAPDQLEYYRRIGKNYATAVKGSGAKRIVYLSSYGAHLDKGTGFILGAHDVEGILDGLTDVAVTHLRPGYFYYNLYNFKDMIKEAGIIGANYGGDDRIVMVSPADIAVAAAEELDQPSTGRKIRYIASGEYTASEAARILGNAIGKPDLQWVVFSDEQMKAGMESRGIPASIVANFVELGASLHSGALIEDYERNKPAVMGKVKLEDFAKEFAAAF